MRRLLSRMARTASPLNVCVTTSALPAGPLAELKSSLSAIQHGAQSVDCRVAAKKVVSGEELRHLVDEGTIGILCTLEDRIDRNLIRSLPNLKVISTVSVGFDHVDVAALAERQADAQLSRAVESKRSENPAERAVDEETNLNGALRNDCSAIRLGNTPGVLTESTADLTVALMLAAGRRLSEGITAVRTGEWQRWELDYLCGKDLHGAYVGIFGMGRIGYAVARRLALGFGCNVIYHSRTRQHRYESGIAGAGGWLGYAESLDALCAQSDFLSVHAPLTEHTRNIFNAQQFQKMKRGSLFINTARGGLVDQDALVEALESGHIAGAGLDVTTPEPLSPSHALANNPKVVVLPHLGSATEATRTKMADIAVANLIAGLQGDAMHFEVPISAATAPKITPGADNIRSVLQREGF